MIKERENEIIDKFNKWSYRIELRVILNSILGISVLALMIYQVIK